MGARQRVPSSRSPTSMPLASTCPLAWHALPMGLRNDHVVNWKRFVSRCRCVGGLMAWVPTAIEVASESAPFSVRVGAKVLTLHIVLCYYMCANQRLVRSLSSSVALVMRTKGFFTR
jgi:hypothetical protein